MKSSTFPNFRHLQVFSLVVRLQSLTLAAAEAHLSQPTVTQAISNLEDRFGTALLERRRSGSYPTPAGTILAERADRLFMQMQEAIRDFIARPDTASDALIDQMVNKLTGGHLNVLITVAESGSFQRAANAMGISESSAHRLSRDLEQNLRRPIFRKTANGKSTTIDGAELARRMKLAAMEIDYAAEQIDAEKGIARTRLSIGTGQLANSGFLASVVQKFVSQHPQSQIIVEERPLRVLLEDLRFGKLDIIFGLLDRVDPPDDIADEPLFPDSHIIVVRAGHPLARRRKVTIADLASYDWITPGPESHRQLIFDKIFASSNRIPRISIETHSLNIHLGILSIGDSIGILKEEEIAIYKQMGLLKVLNFTLPKPKAFVGITTRAGWQPTPVQGDLLQLMREEAKLSGKR